MALAGRQPKPDGQKVTRHPLTHDWVDVLDAPYEGPKPQLVGRYPAATKAWWLVISFMPHCVLWSPSDWQFAMDTARVHADAVRGVSKSAWGEVRQREKTMGTTAEARVGLRIRYVRAEAEPPRETGDDNVRNFEEERRKRLMEDE